MSKFLPDLTAYQDSEAKRRAENLSGELELIVARLGTAPLTNAELLALSTEANKVWWEMNSQVGKVFDQARIERAQNWQFKVTAALSVVALILSVFSIIISMQDGS
jgi:hypothetical protein